MTGAIPWCGCFDVIGSLFPVIVTMPWGHWKAMFYECGNALVSLVGYFL